MSCHKLLVSFLHFYIYNSFSQFLIPVKQRYLKSGVLHLQNFQLFPKTFSPSYIGGKSLFISLHCIYRHSECSFR